MERRWEGGGEFRRVWERCELQLQKEKSKLKFTGVRH